jgi:lipid II:glycine glycyltransferase (peptidoglycan interpeptide bridge formation enzyme)
MGRTSCRKPIKEAQKIGVKINFNQNYEEFFEINRQFRKKKGLDVYSESIEFMKKYGTLLTAEFNGEILLGHFYLEDKNNIRAIFSGSKRFNVDGEKANFIANANRYCIWNAIKYAKDKGIKEYDAGGYYTGEKEDIQKENINVFKKSFGGNLVTHYVYEKDYSKIYSLTKKIFELKQNIIGKK